MAAAFESLIEKGEDISTPDRLLASKQVQYKVIVCSLALMTLILDINTPADIDIGLFYCLAIAGCGFTNSFGWLWSTLGLCVALVFAGAFLGAPPHQLALWSTVLTNRTVTCISLVLEAILVHQWISSRKITVGVSNRLATIIANHPGCVEILDNQGCLVDMNRAGLEMLEVGSLAEARGRPLTNYLRAEYRDAFVQLQKEVMRGQNGSLEFEIQGDRGQRRWLETHAAPMRGAGGQIEGLLGITLDITQRRQAEEALRKSEIEFETLANTIPQLCWMADGDGWIFWYNRRWYEYTGLVPEDTKGWGWQTVHDPRMLPQVLNRWKDSISTGEPFDMVFPLRGSDGVFRSFLTRVMPVRDSDGKVVRWFGTNTDITDARKVEEALNRYADLLRNSFDAILLWSLDGAIETWNRGAERLYGFSAEEALGRRSHDLLQTTFPRPWEEVRAILLEAGVWEGDLKHRTRTGGEVIVSARFQLSVDSEGAAKVLEINRDITERKRAENALRQSESRYSMLAEALPAIIFLASAGGSVEYVNRRWQEYTGIRDKSTSDPAVIVHKDDFERARDAKALSLETGSPYEAEIRLRRHDGVYRWFRIRATAVRDEGGRILNWLGIATDIEDEKQAEERLRESQKMEAIGRLAGGVAHDFNNLLLAIGGYSAMAMDQLQDRPPILEYLQQVTGAAERAAELTRQMLAFSRRQVIQPKLVNLNTAVEKIGKLLARVIGEDIQLASRLAPDLGLIQADPTQLDQIIMNLAVNARDAMPDGGRLTLETANAAVREDEADRHHIQAGAYIVLTVSDTGVGMDEQTKRRIFEPFFTTKDRGKGTGLGLAIVYGVVSQAGGAIQVDSEQGSGTSFRIYLPRHLAAGESDTSAEAALPPEPGGETILLVEDEGPVRKLVEAILHKKGFSVLEAATPGEAIRLAAGHQQPIDVLITDVLMPEMRGPDLAQRIRALRPAIVVIFMSGYSESTFLAPAVLGDATYLQKPFTAEELVRKLREALSGKGR